MKDYVCNISCPTVCSVELPFTSFQFNEDIFQLQTQALYDQHCTGIEESDVGISAKYGINSRSIHNQSRYFHIIGGLPRDAMHDVLEGLLQYEIE